MTTAKFKTIPGERMETREPQKESSWRDQTITAAELQNKDFPPIMYVVPGLLPEGLSIVAGRPKIGKSWLALDICLGVSDGRICLGSRNPTPGDVLYVALEDNPRRLQRRIDRLLSPFADKWPSRLTLATRWRRLDEGGVEDIRGWIKSTPNARLIVLDTLAGVRPIKTNQGYTEDYESLAALHRLANETGVAIVVLHHTRKLEADDPVDTISGTLGLAGCADTALVIQRTSKGTTLYSRGRDVEESEYALLFDRVTCRWSIMGEAAEVQRSDTRRQILLALEMASEPMRPAEIAAATGIDRNTVDQRLHGMVADGEVIKLRRGQYAHPAKAMAGEGP